MNNSELSKCLEQAFTEAGKIVSTSKTFKLQVSEPTTEAHLAAFGAKTYAALARHSETLSGLLRVASNPEAKYRRTAIQILNCILTEQTTNIELRDQIAETVVPLVKDTRLGSFVIELLATNVTSNYPNPKNLPATIYNAFSETISDGTVHDMARNVAPKHRRLAGMARILDRYLYDATIAQRGAEYAKTFWPEPPQQGG